jgi:HK97 family phage major capsid protein
VNKFAETNLLLRDNMILNGSGIGQPSGILLNPGGTDQPAVVNTGASGAVTADGIESIGWSLPSQYDDNAAWVFNKVNVGQAIAKLKDSNNRYLWGAGLQDSGLTVPIKGRQLLGYDVVMSSFMPNLAANAYIAIFGDLSGYYLVDRVGFSVQVLRELYAETNQILLLGRVRFGGVVAEPWRMLVHKAA